MLATASGGPSTWVRGLEHTDGQAIPPSASPPRCIQCNPGKKAQTRNLVVCIDGTCNRFDKNNTNVAKLLSKINLESHQPEQRTYYSSGLGMHSQSLTFVDRIKSAASDVSWEAVVTDAYSWLAGTYQAGDQLYFFGFSRGAYQVRMLAKMIHEVGLMKTPTEKQIRVAYNHYKHVRSGELNTRHAAREFKRTFSWTDVNVHFVGVWDTVFPAGQLKEDVFLSTSSTAHACHFRHALALDERRVKFMPEYLLEMNSRSHGKSKHSVADSNAESPTQISDIKEVWFAGCHPDVGGRNRPEMLYHAGNVSLMWMRREAAAHGLALKPTDVIWSPEDLDFGASNPMTLLWKAIEYVPVKHQASFSGAGGNATRLHRMQSRRIIPGQKIHISVLYSAAHNPQGRLGEGFDIPGTEVENSIWETGVFDDTAAEQLVTYLGSQQPKNLCRLLFMLRFEEGKQCIRNISRWQDKLIQLTENQDCEPLVKLVAIVTYHEVSCDPGASSKLRGTLPAEPLQDIFNDAKTCLKTIACAPTFDNALVVTALLRFPIMIHQTLQDRIFTGDALSIIFWLFDMVFLHPDWTIVQRRQAFGQVVDSMGCLMHRKDTRNTLVEKLGDNPSVSPLSQMLMIIRGRRSTFGGLVMSALIKRLGLDNLRGSNIPRLALTLRSNDAHLLTAALRMVLTLSGFEEAKVLCSALKPQLKLLAKKDDSVVGVLAVEILLALYDQNDWHGPVNIQQKEVRANLARALTRVHLGTHDWGDRRGSNGHPGRRLLGQLFGLDAIELSDSQRRLIKELERSVEKGNGQERGAATMTLLKLCETPTIRTFLCEINLLDVFIDQLRRKDSSLLAAYALATCLKYDDLKESIEHNDDFPKYVVDMLTFDYFDDAVGQVEGFQIFADLIKHDNLWRKIKEYNIVQILTTKLEEGKEKGIRTSLIALDIFQSFDPEGSWANDLVGQSLDRLLNQGWKDQKAGLMILFALSQTEHGMEAIKPHIPEIIRILLPAALQLTPTRPTSFSQRQTRLSSESGSTTSPEASPRPPSRMMGPACALCIFAQNAALREHMRGTTEYGTLRHLYLSGVLVSQKDTSPWHPKTPNRADLMTILKQIISTMDGGVLDGPMSIGDDVLPHVRHWDLLVKELGNRTVSEIVSLSTLLGVSVAAVLVAIASAVVSLPFMCLRLVFACISL